ncbi:MAG: iron-sulfur cluster assembly accessory protein [Cyanobacteria bacterium P01_A01_bin.45]
MTVTLTPKAQLRLESFLSSSANDSKESTKGIRLWIEDGGCNGREYQMEITKTPQADDLVFQSGKVPIYVDAKSASLLKGIVIDFVEGVMESGFKFTNPNASDTCDCGKSFAAGDDCPSKGVSCK